LRQKVPAAWCRTLVYGSAIVVLVWLVSRFLDEAEAPALVSNLLFADQVPKTASSPVSAAEIAMMIKQTILRGDDSYVSHVYGNVLSATVMAVLVATFVWWLTAAWRLRLLAFAPFALGATIFVILLPFDYGVLQKAVEFPRIIAHLSPAKGGSSDTEGFLVDKSATSILVWDPGLHRLMEIPSDQVLGLEIMGNEPLFSASPVPDGSGRK